LRRDQSTRRSQLSARSSRFGLVTGFLLALLTATSAKAQTHLLIVSGLGGEAKYSTRFQTLATSLADAAVKRFGIPDSEVVWLGEDSVSKAPHFRGH